MSLVETTTNLEKPLLQMDTLVYRVDILPLTPEFAEKVHIPQLGTLYSHPVYWFRSTAFIPQEIEKIAQEFLIDPILQTYQVSTLEETAQPLNMWAMLGFQWIAERQFLPGVTDNLGKTVEKSLSLLFKGQKLPEIQVASGQVYWFAETHHSETEILKALAYQVFNPLVQRLSLMPFATAQENRNRYAFPWVQISQQRSAETIALDLSDADLKKLSQQRNLALSLDEMKTIQHYYEKPEIQEKRKVQALPPWPTDVELEIFAQTWSEHCKHKIFAAKIHYTDAADPDFPLTTEIDSLFKTYIAGSTLKLQTKRPDLLSVFKDNAGVLRWNDQWGICFKVETHNSPSALEPYGGALTGIVGVNRDVLGTGLGAKPLFNTDVFCFAHPDEPHLARPTMLPAESILLGVRKGVEDGGNKSGIPTVNGSLFFDCRYRAKPLVFCGTGGLLPLKVGDRLGYEKYTQPGDTIVMAGGRVGKDGIHGATFSSEALNQESPVSAVQIGDPITQKRLMDFQMEALQQGLISGITDNGAGGLSSSVGEMAQLTGGATIYLEKVPLKYAGLAPYEIMISESQERMTISTKNYDALLALANQYDVEIAAIGEFHAEGTFKIIQNGQLLASLDLDFLHHGLPQMQLRAVWYRTRMRPLLAKPPSDPGAILLKLLASPNICSREALIRQYDHEVQGRSAIKPLMGPLQTAPCDAAVIQPLLDRPEGLVISNGLCPQYSDWDTYAMAACALDEAVRNAVAVGADPDSIALLDNFCWPDPLVSSRNFEAELKLAQLVRACQALYDLSLTYETPLISGKDSMKNDFDDGTFRLSIPPTLLVSAIGKIPDVQKAISMEFKTPGDRIFVLGRTHMHMGGSQYHRVMGWYSPYCPWVQGALAKKVYRKLYEAIQKDWIRSCHDLSEGGLAVALAESALGGICGVEVSMSSIAEDAPELRWDDILFSESPSRFVVSVSAEHTEAFLELFKDLPVFMLGDVTASPQCRIKIRTSPTKSKWIDLDVEALRSAWRRAPAKCYESAMQP
jgi:phosphoribosylformylglycinamidine synthase subunit PurSL